MKTLSAFKRTLLTLAILVAVFIGLVSQAQAAALQGRLALRPLTPQEVKDYSLTGIQTASGLTTIALGQPAYIDALINTAVPTSDNVTVVWTLTNAPVGSVAVLTNSPLGTNVPTYRPVDRASTKVGGRAMLRPDVVGQYTIKATITTATSGTTNLTLTITAGTFVVLRAQILARCVTAAGWWLQTLIVRGCKPHTPAPSNSPLTG